MDCIFCKIISGEIPSKKVYENNSTIAFLDINPANKGHVLVAPKKHSETILDSDENDLKETIISVKEIASRIKERLNSDGINVIQNNGKIAGQIVNHIHFHVIPRFEGDKVVINYERQQMDESALDEVQKTLSDFPEKKSKTELDFEL